MKREGEKLGKWRDVRKSLTETKMMRKMWQKTRGRWN